jgi:hypothetical protein
MEAAEFGRFFPEGTRSVDPLASKFPAWSPYNYTMNNPVIMVDPDGRQVTIYYYNNDGKLVPWTFNGKNANEAPDNLFIRQFLSVWKHAIKVDGFDNLKKAVEMDKIIELYASDLNQAANYGLDTRVKWDPDNATKYPETGVTVSPATVLEHEMDHAVSLATDRIGHSYRKERERTDGYTDDEEHRVITGSEQKTARAMGEIGGNQVTRTKHDSKGKKIRVDSPLKRN